MRYAYWVDFIIRKCYCLIYKNLFSYKALWFSICSNCLALFYTFQRFCLYCWILFGSFLYFSAVLFILLNSFLLVKDIGFNSCYVLLTRAYNLLAIWQFSIRNELLDCSNHFLSKCNDRGRRFIFNLIEKRNPEKDN